eukprot:Seg3398.5 transcript_id=Seg3398.5/GoldUCD/mRNA.D3Y31 product="Transmembrane protein 246" pseudo=true protein_id=Seg3398.5/GoldUCD/D3Y31
MTRPKLRRRWSYVRLFLIGFVPLSVNIFVFILPWTCSELGFSSFYTEINSKEKIERQNEIRYEDSTNYLQTHKIEADVSRVLQQFRFANDDQVKICISILSTYRVGSPGYLIQTVAKLLKEVEHSSKTLNFEFKVFNAEYPAENNNDVSLLRRLELSNVQILQRSEDGPFLEAIDEYDKHRLDLIEALKVCNDKKYDFAMVLEDDAFSVGQFASRFENLINKLQKDDSIGYVKLYHPEKWQGFGQDTKREIILIGAVSFLLSSACLWFFIGSRFRTIQTSLEVLLFSTLTTTFVIIFCYTFSRQHLLEFLQYHTKFHFIVDAPGCCTSAVLYRTKDLNGFIRYLENDVICSKDLAVDLIPDIYFGKIGLKCLQIIPNLFFHIGFHSSVQRATKDPKEFFHLYPPKF